MTNQIFLDIKRMNILQYEEGGEEEVALLNFVILKIKDEVLARS